MFYQIKSYIKFYLRSINEHGVHSPFVYDLLTKCFYNKTQFAEYKILEEHRKKLLKSDETIEVTDFGQGSRVFKSNHRRVSAIAKNAGITSKRQKLLFRLSNYFPSEKILELGTSLGLATSALALGNPSANIKTVEGCSNTAEKASELFNAFKLKNIELQSKTFEDFFVSSSEENINPLTYDLVYIDGNHNKEKTIQYFESLLKLRNNNSVFIFDDIYWSPQMTEAWKEIINNPAVTVSIDTFYWGLIFFRKEQKKQQFSIRL